MRSQNPHMSFHILFPLLIPDPKKPSQNPHQNRQFLFTKSLTLLQLPHTALHNLQNKLQKSQKLLILHPQQSKFSKPFTLHKSNQPLNKPHSTPKELPHNAPLLLQILQPVNLHQNLQKVLHNPLPKHLHNIQTHRNLLPNPHRNILKKPRKHLKAQQIPFQAVKLVLLHNQIRILHLKTLHSFSQNL